MSWVREESWSNIKGEGSPVYPGEAKKDDILEEKTGQCSTGGMNKRNLQAGRTKKGVSLRHTKNQKKKKPSPTHSPLRETGKWRT